MNTYFDAVEHTNAVPDIIIATSILVAGINI